MNRNLRPFMKILKPKRPNVVPYTFIKHSKTVINAKKISRKWIGTRHRASCSTSHKKITSKKKQHRYWRWRRRKKAAKNLPLCLFERRQVGREWERKYNARFMFYYMYFFINVYGSFVACFGAHMMRWGSWENFDPFFL